MSLHPTRIGEISAETVRVARAAFPHGTAATRLRDEFADLYQDEHFRALYPRRGQPGLAPWRLALVTVFQFLEHLSDRQAADAVRARIDWKYALGLDLADSGFHFSVLAEFRARFVAGQAEHLLLDTMLERFKARGLIKPRGRQRTDSTHVLGAVHHLHLCSNSLPRRCAPHGGRGLQIYTVAQRQGPVPPVGERRQSPYDPQLHFSMKRLMQKPYRVRAGVQGTLSQAVRAFGMRQSR